MLFGYPKYKKNLLELFNALNGTNYEDENELEINTIEDTIYMGMKNDVSCIIQSNMAMYEAAKHVESEYASKRNSLQRKTIFKIHKNK